MKNYTKIIDCTDSNVCFGILITPESINYKDVQDKINKIKFQFELERFDDWTISDVFEQFPEEWDWEFVRENTAVI